MSLDLQFVVLYKGPEQEFEEKRALRANLELNRARTQIGLRAESEGAEAGLEAVRIDFDEKPSSFMLHDLRVVSPDGDNLYLWDGSPGQLVGVGFKAVRTIQGVRIDCLDADPQLPIAFHAPLPKWVLISITVTEAVGEGAFLQPIDEVLQNQEIMHAELSRHLRAFTAAMADFTVAEEDVDQALLELRNAGVAQSSLHERRVDSLRGVLEQVLGTLASIESEAVNLRDGVAATADSSALKVLEAIRPLAIAIGAAREAADVSYQALRVGIAEGDAQADLFASKLSEAIGRVEAKLQAVDSRALAGQEETARLVAPLDIATQDILGILNATTPLTDAVLQLRTKAVVDEVVGAFETRFEGAGFARAFAALTEKLDDQARLLTEQQHAAEEAAALRVQLVQTEHDRAAAHDASERALSQAEHTGRELEDVRRALSTLHASTSWRVTRPMRAFRNMIKPPAKSQL